MPTVPVRDATPRDHDRIAWLLTAGFVTTPLAQWLVPDTDRRNTYATVFFDRAVGLALEDPRSVVHATVDGSAAAIWYDHRDTASTDPLGDLAALVPEDVDPVVAARLSLLRALLTDFRPTLAHYRLGYLAVDASRRQQGLAQAVLAHQHHRLDMAGLPAHTIAQCSTDLALLGMTGYLAHRPVSTADGPLVWPAWRRPQPAYPIQRANSS